MDTLTPADGSVRFWVLSDDPRFQYGKGLDEIERVNQGEAGHGTLALPISGRTLPHAVDAHRRRSTTGPPVRLIVGVDTAPFEHTLRAFLIALTLLTLGAVALVMVLGYWIARIGLRPLQRLSREARALRPKTLSQRLHAAAPAGRAGRPGRRLQRRARPARGRPTSSSRRFNADVAHELRTPLANLIGGTQVALSRPRSAAEFEETLQSNLEELERLRSIVNDMLFLARADQGEAATGLASADVGARGRARPSSSSSSLLDETGTHGRDRGRAATRRRR